MWICNSCGSNEIYQKIKSVELLRCDKDGIETFVADEKLSFSYICDVCCDEAYHDIRDLAYWEDENDTEEE